MFTRRMRQAALGLAAGLAVSAAIPAHAIDPGPINAGNTYKWGPITKRYEFEQGIGSRWRVHGKGALQDRYGMLSLNSTRHGSLSATLRAPGHKYGRWEVRVRTREWDTKYAQYRLSTQLVPTGRSGCGDRNIALGNFVNLGHRAELYARNGRRAFTATDAIRIRNEHFHTLAVEVTPKHVAWFVDAHVVRIERKPAASSGVPLTIRIGLTAKPGRTMNRTMLQYDWMRYWTLRQPDAKPLNAPSARAVTYKNAC